MLGLKRGTVKLVSAHDEWSRYYEQEKQLLLDTFGDRIIAIEHVGSTSIPGLPAKPIIDMNMAITSIDDNDIQKFVEKLEELGYHYMHKFPERHFFAKGPEEMRTHHLNLVELGSDQWKNSISFRNYLRNNEDVLKEYTTLKEKLAGQFAEDRASYTKAKEEFIERILKLAKQDMKK